MRKVRIYSLKKELGLDNCTPILTACQKMGLEVNSPSSTITKAQARQVASWVSRNRSQAPTATSRVKQPRNPLVHSKPSPRSQRTAPSTATQVSTSKPLTEKKYLNGNRVFTLEISGLKGARTRQAITTYSVPFHRLGSEIQRINRSEAKIVGIRSNL